MTDPAAGGRGTWRSRIGYAFSWYGSYHHDANVWARPLASTASSGNCSGSNAPMHAAPIPSAIRRPDRHAVVARQSFSFARSTFRVMPAPCHGSESLRHEACATQCDGSREMTFQNEESASSRKLTAVPSTWM